jgi:hypothetical protein
VVNLPARRGPDMSRNPSCRARERVRRLPSLTGKCSRAYPRPEDDFLGATGPCAGRPKVPSVGSSALHGRGSSSPPVRI